MRESRTFLTSISPAKHDGTGPDYRVLSKFGQIIPLTESHDHIVNNTERIAGQIRERLTEFDPQVDYLTWAGGDPLAALLVGAELNRRGVERLQWLRFDRMVDPDTGRRMTWKGNYVPVPIIL